MPSGRAAVPDRPAVARLYLLPALIPLAWSAPALAQNRCLDPQGLNTCPPEPQRPADREEERFWKRQSGEPPPELFPQSMGPVVPGSLPGTLLWMPHSLAPTRDGKVGMGDLGLQSDGNGGYHGRRPGYRFDIERDGTIHFQNPPPISGVSVVGLGMAAAFDLTDLVMRAAGMDPYVYDKGMVAELTRPMRARMAEAERPRRIAAALQRLPRDLDALWARDDMSAADKRATILQLWDEILDDPPAGAQAPEVVAAERARTALVRFVSWRLPAGSPDAFTAAELAAFNARRRSRLAFDPYRP
jgi:hypothetical protein